MEEENPTINIWHEALAVTYVALEEKATATDEEMVRLHDELFNMGLEGEKLVERAKIRLYGLPSLTSAL